MSTKVIMPQMGESIFEGTITKWLKKVGDPVARDEPLFEISTDKVDSEIPAPASGVLSEIVVPEGATVQINTVVGVISEPAAAAALAPVPEPAEAEEIAPAPEIAEVLEKAEIPAEPAPAPPPGPAAAAEAPAVPPAIEVPGEAGRAAEEKPVTPRPSIEARDVRTSPLVRRLAREHKIDLSKIQGTGMSGRITKQDIENYLGRQVQPTAPVMVPAMPPKQVAAEAPRPPEPAKPAAPPLPPAAPPVSAAPPPPQGMPTPEPPKPVAPPAEAIRFAGDIEIVPMTVMRKSIAEHMVMSKRTSAHVSTVFQVDMTSIVQLREKHMAEFEAREGIKLTYTPFFVKALVDTVRDFPIVNCSVSGDNIIYKKPVNVGVAVALETGLIVPVVKDAHLRSFTGLALAINDLAERARTKKLKPEDVQNGTISITNPGIYGSLFGTPIIHQPQAAILGVGGIEKRPVVINDAIAIRSMVYLSLSFDHRVIDGAVADQFMAALKKRLESWSAWTE
jgi:2-oxoglutarate dehydrogenase E2 component (dihydrolipoamide succinyltransferase)